MAIIAVAMLVYHRVLNVPIERPTLGELISPTDICFGDVKQVPKKGHLPNRGKAQCRRIMDDHVGDGWRCLKSSAMGRSRTC